MRGVCRGWVGGVGVRCGGGMQGCGEVWMDVTVCALSTKFNLKSRALHPFSDAILNRSLDLSRAEALPLDSWSIC